MKKQITRKYKNCKLRLNFKNIYDDYFKFDIDKTKPWLPHPAYKVFWFVLAGVFPTLRRCHFVRKFAIAWFIFQHCEYKMDQNTTQMSREYEYEIQFFGFTPDSFVNGGETEF